MAGGIGQGGRVVAIAALALWTGCQKSDQELQPVAGQVLLNGQPVQGAKVILQPVSEADALATNPAGTTDTEGKFQLSTHPHGEGAKPGDYVACLIVPPGASASVAGTPLAKLPAKYASRDTSGLPVSIKPGVNQLEPFQLTK